MAIESFSPVSSPYTISSVGQTSSLSRTEEAMASGSQVNRSADNPAVQAIITEFSKQINTQDMATQNANSGISLLQTAGGATQGMQETLQQMNQLSIQAQNGTYSASQRAMMNEQYQAGMESINQLAQNTSFNGTNLLNADTMNVDLALGAGSNSNYSIGLPNLTPDNLGLTGFDISNPTNAALAQQASTAAMEMLTNTQTQFGAQQNGLTSAVENLNTQNLNAAATRSQMSDTDFTRAFTEQVRQQLLGDVSTAMQAQSNQSRGQALQLLG